MPINRSPPPSTPQSLLPDPIHHCSSEPDLSKAIPAKSESVGTELGRRRRTKRKLTIEPDSQLQNFTSEMRNLFSNFKDEQNKKFEALCATMEDLKTAFEFTTQKYNTALEEINKLEQERDADRSHIKNLVDRLETFECHARASCIEIRNVPSTIPEPKESLLKTVLSTTRALNLQVEQSDIKDVYRISTMKDSSNKTIIVDFVSTLLKEKVLSQYKRQNREKRQLTTEHIKIGGPAKPIFMSENLSAYMKRVFFLARDFKKTNNFDFCWVKNGKIFLRKKEGAPIIRISHETDLNNLKVSAE